MAKINGLLALVAGAVVAAGISTATASAGGPGGYVEGVDIATAVGSGEFLDTLIGFVARGPSNEEASAKVLAQCESAGGVLCTVDEVTNDKLCIASVASPITKVVAGGAGVTIEAAHQDALNKAAAAGTPEGPDATIVVSACNE
jgi:hypothetical protein